jgi:transcriptional antiterminator NusG
MTSRWYALAVHPRRERVAAEDLERRGFDIFLPTSVTRKAWSDRIKRVETPLFPGYLFVQSAMDATTRRALLRARATYDLVGRLPGDGRIARSIPATDIESLRVVVRCARTFDPVLQLVPGRRIEVGAGPLRGARGVVEMAADGRRRLIVQLELLGRGVRTALSADDVLIDHDEERRAAPSPEPATISAAR